VVEKRAKHLNLTQQCLKEIAVIIVKYILIVTVSVLSERPK